MSETNAARYPKSAGRKRGGKQLTDTEIRKAKPRERPYKLSDSRGLFLLVTPTGGKLWRFKYEFSSGRGREKLLALGSYPDVSLSDARDARDAARKMIASGVDPSAQRRIERAAVGDTFEAVARAWFAKFSPAWVDSYSRTVLSRMELHLFPRLGARPIRAIQAPEIFAVLERLEACGTYETARRVRRIASYVFSYAIAQGKATGNPVKEMDASVILSKRKAVPRAAVTKPAEVAGLLRVLDGYNGTMVVRCALRLAPLVFVRPGELRKAEWVEFDLDGAQWEIPAERMKMREPLLVPLSKQAVKILRELRQITGDGRYVFPSARSAHRPMSDNAVLSAFRRCGIEKDEMSGHGFRAMARTILDEVLHVRVDIIEHQLAHAVRDPNGRAYNRTSFLPERIVMMQQWADYLDSLKAGSAPRPRIVRDVA